MLIGRNAEQRALMRLAAAARVSQSGTLVVVGEAGIGKTVLLEQLAEQAEGLRVLRVRGSETERDLAFGGLDQLLRPLLGLLGDIPPPQARAVEVALALAPGVTTGSAPTRTDRFAISAATLSLLSRAAEDRPTLVLLDDAHALDRPSAEALVFTARRILADPLALVAASRPSGGVLLEAGLPRLDLAGLSAAEVTRLLAERAGSPVPAALGARVHGSTAGNPLAVVELASVLDRVEQLTPATPITVPGRVQDEYARRVTTLGEATRTALLVASIAADADLAAAAARLGVDLVDLAAAEAAGLVDLLPGGVEFRHPLARAGAYAVASPRQRRAAHLAVAAVARDPDRRAWHLGEGALGLDDAVASDLAAAALRSRARGAHAVAASGFERAAALTTAREERAGRLLAAGEEAALAGHGVRAAALLDRAATGTGDPLLRARVDALRAAVEQRWGSLERSRELAGRALGPLAAADPDAAVDAAADLVATCMYLGDAERAGRTAALLESLAARASEPARVRALLSSGIARVLAGQAGIALIRAAMASMAPGPPAAEDDLGPGWLVMGPLFAREESGPSRELVDQALQRLRETSAIASLAGLLFQVAKYAASTDRWDQAAGHYQEGIPLAREAGQTTDLTQLLAGLAWLEARTGAEESCRAHAGEAIALAERHHVHLGRIWATYALGDLELGLGRPVEALTHYRRLQAFLDRIGFRDVDVCPAPEVVECLHRSGRDEEAAPLASDYRSRAAAKGQAWALARAERATAVVSSDPRPGLERALTLHAASPDLFEQARTRLMLGEFERRERHRSVARDLLGAAVGAFDDLGARPWADRAARELAATGARVHRRADHSLDLLTPQEVQVAQLLAGGHTTRQAAAAMFLSPKTVEYHLRHVYTKLGINNRADLADALGAIGSGRPLGP